MSSALELPLCFSPLQPVGTKPEDLQTAQRRVLVQVGSETAGLK